MQFDALFATRAAQGRPSNVSFHLGTPRASLLGIRKRLQEPATRLLAGSLQFRMGQNILRCGWSSCHRRNWHRLGLLICAMIAVCPRTSTG